MFEKMFHCVVNVNEVEGILVTFVTCNYRYKALFSMEWLQRTVVMSSFSRWSTTMTNHVVVKIQVTGEAKASPTLDKLEIYGDGPGRPLDSSHVDLCLILLRC